MDNKETSEQVTEETAADNQETTANNDAQNEPSIENLQKTLIAAQESADKNKEQALRTLAEMDNLKKRQARELENAHKYALERFSNELLSVRDTLELGINAASEENASLEKLTEGSALTLKMMADVMEKFGIQKIAAEGQPFDPAFHQAMSMIPSAEVEPNTVLQVVQAGYTLNDRLLRPAMVMVSQKTP